MRRGHPRPTPLANPLGPARARRGPRLEAARPPPPDSARNHHRPRERSRGRSFCPSCGAELRFVDDPRRIVALDPVYICAYIPMRFEWDPKKAEENYRKHFIRFSEVEPVFDDEHAIEFLDESSEEERYLGIGMDGFGRVLVVVYTWRGENVRLIS